MLSAVQWMFSGEVLEGGDGTDGFDVDALGEAQREWNTREARQRW